MCDKRPSDVQGTYTCAFVFYAPRKERKAFSDNRGSPERLVMT